MPPNLGATPLCALFLFACLANSHGRYWKSPVPGLLSHTSLGGQYLPQPRTKGPADSFIPAFIVPAGQYFETVISFIPAPM